MRIDTLLIRMSGPILFSAAFATFIIGYNTVTDYVSNVKAEMLEGQVYEQSDVDGSDELFSFDKDGAYEVTGSYLLGVLYADIDQKTIIISDNGTVYKRLELDPNLKSGNVIYTAFKKQLSASSVDSLKVASSGKWIPGQYFPLNYIIDSTAKYKVTSTYAPTGILESITYEKL